MFSLGVAQTPPAWESAGFGLENVFGLVFLQLFFQAKAKSAQKKRSGTASLPPKRLNKKDLLQHVSLARGLALGYGAKSACCFPFSAQFLWTRSNPEPGESNDQSCHRDGT